MVDDFVEWLNSPQPSTTSKVGILSSPLFLDLLKSSTELDSRLNFQRMIYAASLAYNQSTAPGNHTLCVSELHQISSIAGQDILRLLDQKLRPDSLRSSTSETLQSLFLLLFGTILAVGYVRPIDNIGIHTNEVSHQTFLDKNNTYSQ